MTASVIADVRRGAKPAELVLDLETISGWNDLPHAARNTILEKHAEAEARLPKECRGNPRNHPMAMAAVNPWTARVICACLYAPALERGFALYVGSTAVVPLHDGIWKVRPCETERDLLLQVWDTLDRHPDARVVGFNSRRFDALMLFVRSYVHDVECTTNLLPYRYSTKEHLDLYDVLGGWGEGRVPSLDVVSELVEIPTSKGSLDGSQVQAYWDAGRVAEIVAYCAGDVLCTAAHLARWNRTVGRVFGERKRGW